MLIADWHVSFYTYDIVSASISYVLYCINRYSEIGQCSYDQVRNFLSMHVFMGNARHVLQCLPIKLNFNWDVCVCLKTDCNCLRKAVNCHWNCRLYHCSSVVRLWQKLYASPNRRLRRHVIMVSSTRMKSCPKTPLQWEAALWNGCDNASVHFSRENLAYDLQSQCWTFEANQVLTKRGQVACFTLQPVLLVAVSLQLFIAEGGLHLLTQWRASPGESKDLAG